MKSPSSTATNLAGTRAIFFLKVLVFLLVVGKGAERLVFAAIWAEDGKVFLKQAFEIGWLSLFQPYDGYFHTIPRLIALFGTLLPISLIPSFIVIACYLIFTYVITTLLNRPYRWLFGTMPIALFCTLVLLVSPGQSTMLGNATNLHWYLLLLLAILSLKDINEDYTAGEIAIAFLCIASEGAVIILLPVFAVRVWLKRGRPWPAKIGELSIGLLILVFTVINISISRSTSVPLSFDNLVEVFASYFSGFFLLHIFVGDVLALELLKHDTWLTVSAVIVCGIVFRLLLIKWEQRYLLIVTLSWCALLLPVMIALVRPQNVMVLKEFFHYDVELWFRFRYSFFVPAIAALFWFFCIGRLVSTQWLAHLMIAVILLSQFVVNHYRIPVARYENHTGWSSQAAQLQQSIRSGCPRQVLVPINPPGWEVLFRTGDNDDCLSPPQ